MKKLHSALIIGASIVFTAVTALAQTSSWTVDGTKVKLNGNDFLFRGVNYAPVPYGASPTFTPPYGSYFIPKAAPIFNRDIPLMRAMGTNSIRLYAGVNEVINGLDVANYQQFLDALWNNGTDPIYVFMYAYHDVGRESKSSPDFNDTKAKLVSLMTRWKDHPAVAGIVIGNETEGGPSVYNNQAYWQGIGEICDAIKAVAPNKLTLNAMVDDGNGQNYSPKVQAAYQYREFLGNLDIIGINCYRGADLGTKASSQDPGVSNSVFLGYSRSWPNSPKPLLITEFGISWGTGGTNVREANSTEQVQKGKNYIRENWTVIRDNYQGKDGDSQVSVGGFVFSWVDEWYKINNTATVHNANEPVAFNGNFPGGQNDEEWFGVMRIDNTKVSPNNVTWDINNIKADPLIKRSTYDILQSLWKSAPQSKFTAQAGGAVAQNVDDSYETWFGTVYEDTYPWIYQYEHDWAYVAETVGEGVWLYDESFDLWMWTAEGVYPWYWVASETPHWIYYYVDTDNPQVFYDGLTEEVFYHFPND